MWQGKGCVCVTCKIDNNYTGGGRESLVKLPSWKWHLKIRLSFWNLGGKSIFFEPLLLSFLVLILLWFCLPFKTNIKTSLETNFQTRPRPSHVLKQNFKKRPIPRLVLIWKFCQDQDKNMVLTFKVLNL